MSNIISKSESTLDGPIFALHEVELQAKHCHGSHMGNPLLRQKKEMLNSWKTEKSKVKDILRDSARKMQDLYEWFINLVNIKEEKMNFGLVPVLADTKCCGNSV